MNSPALVCLDHTLPSLTPGALPDLTVTHTPGVTVTRAWLPVIMSLPTDHRQVITRARSCFSIVAIYIGVFILWADPGIFRGGQFEKSVSSI